MSDARLVAVSVDNEPRKYGYAAGVGHAFLIPAGFQNDPLGWLCEESEAATVCGRTADGSRLVEKWSGDTMCGRCCRVVTDEMIMAAVMDRDAEPGTGESVADMVMSDPDAVLITLDSVLAESEGTDGSVSPEASEVAQTVSAVPERSGRVKGAKDAGQKIARQSDWKPVKEVPEAVPCESGAPFVDLGDGRGTCRSCGWTGPVKEIEVLPAEKAERVWCVGGAMGVHGCTACGRDDVKVTRKGNLARHKTPGVIQSAVTELGMVAHWTHGRAPQNVVTLLEAEEQKGPKPAPLSEAPATVDSGRKSHDDLVASVLAGMYRGRTSLTRGSDMTGAVPRERVEGGKPVPTTNDGPLGRYHRTDVSSRTDKRIQATGDGDDAGVAIVVDRVGGVHGFLSSAEYEAKRNQPDFAKFKKSYWRKVRRARLAAERAAERKAVARELAGKRAVEAETRALGRIAATAPSVRRSRGKR